MPRRNMAMPLFRAPDFWWRPHHPVGYVLAPLGAVYGRVSERRMDGAGVSAGVPVICIGNLVLGGAGKTPTALAVADACRQLRLQPGFLTRGYGGSEKGPLVVSSALHTAREVGDEALLLVQNAPTVVSRDRPNGAKLLASLGVDIVIMDDGFQNPSLAKDIAVLVVDGARGIGNGLVFPAGPLRAPLAAQIRRADALFVLGEGTGGRSIRMAARAGLSILRARTEPVRRRGLKRRPYLAFTGIAHPGKFYASLAEAGAQVAFTMDFPDHRMFSEAECERILAEAKFRELVPITTEKDRVRLWHRGGAAEELAAVTETFPIRVRFEEPKRLLALIRDAVERYGSVDRLDRLSRSA